MKKSLLALFILLLSGGFVLAQEHVEHARDAQHARREVKKTRLNTRTYSLAFDKDNYNTLRQSVETPAGAVEVVYKAYLHIPYVAKPLDPDYQSLSIFEPVLIDGKAVDAAQAPILFSNRVGGYMPVDDSTTENVGGRGGNQRESLALAAGMVVVVPGCRGRVNQTEDGIYIGKAPAALVDLKAAVRYLRHNKGVVPGDTEKIVSMGCSAGGAISAALAASGNSPLFEPYLKEIGAADEKDDFFAGGVFSPIMDIQHGDMAYEWEFGEVPLTKTGKLADQALSAELKALFPAYERSLNLQGINGFGQLTADNLGDYIATYWLNPAATLYLKGLSDGDCAEYLKDKAWLKWDGSATHMSMKDYNTYYSGRFKDVPAFDKFDVSEAENGLFGDATHDGRHMTEFSVRHTGEGGIDTDFQQIIDMMNPLHYVVGQLNPGSAKHWWIRHGTTESGISRAAVVNFSTALIGHGCDVNFKLYWEAMHCIDKDPEGFVAWIQEITGWNVKIQQLLASLKDPSGKDILPIAHMGDWHGSSENSIHAIGKAVDKGAAMVSVYLQKTTDGELIMFTDPTLDRMTEGTGSVASKTLAEIKALRMKEYRGEIVDWAVPTLQEGIEATRGKILLRVFADPYLEDVEAMVKSLSADHVVITSERQPSAGLLWFPVVDLDGKKPLNTVSKVLKGQPVAVELRFAKDDNKNLSKALEAISGKARIGMSTMQEGMAGSHVDVAQGADPVPVWGPLREMGATIIQTDQIKPFMIYLTGKQVGPPGGPRPGDNGTGNGRPDGQRGPGGSRGNAAPGQFTNRTFTEGDASLAYNLYVPADYDRSKKYPLVVFVHDAGRISNDPTASTQLEGAKAWTTAESQAKNPCFVLAPQYGTNTLGGETGSVSQQDITLHLIQRICQEFSVDMDRIYGTGQSMGCMQTMEMAMEHPDLFAACLLVSGQLDPEKCDALADKKLWIVVSEDDQRAFPGMNAVTEYWKEKGTQVAYASIPAQLPQETYRHLADSLVACGAHIQYVSLAAGTLPKEELAKYAMGGGPGGPGGSGGQRGQGGFAGPGGPGGSGGSGGQRGQGGFAGPGGPGGQRGSVGSAGPGGQRGSVGSAGPGGQGGSVDAASTRPITAEGAMAHMASFDVIYRIDAFREWLFTQKRGEM